MIVNRFCLIALAAILLPIKVVADPQSECSISVTSQVEIGDCLTKAEQTAEATVTMALGFAMQAAQELDEVTQRRTSAPALEAGQAGWVAYRDQHCTFVGTTYGGGSGTGIAVQSCRITLAGARADELMRYAE